MKPRLLAAGMARLLAIMLTASLAAALMLRFAPGFSSDDREMNSGLSANSIEALRHERMANANIPKFYFHYVLSLAKGDMGTSLSLNQPVRELLHDRLPLTLRNLALALLLGWGVGLLLALAGRL